jgi:hypothetical protein
MLSGPGMGGLGQTEGMHFYKRWEKGLLEMLDHGR